MRLRFGLLTVLFGALGWLACGAFGSDDPPAPVVDGGEGLDAASPLRPDSSLADAASDTGAGPCAITSVEESDGAVPGGDTDCGGTQVSLRDNALHCGACFHVCTIGKNCSQGTCDHEVLAAAGSLLARDGAFLYSRQVSGGADEALMRSALDGGVATELLRPDSGGVTAFTPTVDFLFTSSYNGGLFALPVDGGTPVLLTPSSEGVRSISARGSTAYYSRAALTAVRKVTVDAGPSINIATDEMATTILGDQPSLYWLNFLSVGDGGPASAAVQLVRFNIASGGIVRSAPIATSDQYRASLAIDDVYAYVYEGTSREVRRFSKSSPAGSPGEVVARWRGPSGDFTTHMLVDASNIYVLVQVAFNDSRAQIVKIPRCGGKPQLLAETASQGQLGVDGARIYFSDDVSGTLRRVIK